MKHIHKYAQVRLGKNKQRIYYRCILDGCVHKVEKELVVGRWSICNICSNEFVIDKYAGQLSKPRCVDCRTKRDKEEVDKLTSLFN